MEIDNIENINDERIQNNQLLYSEIINNDNFIKCKLYKHQKLQVINMINLEMQLNNLNICKINEGYLNDPTNSGKKITILTFLTYQKQKKILLKNKYEKILINKIEQENYNINYTHLNPTVIIVGKESYKVWVSYIKKYTNLKCFNIYNIKSLKQFNKLLIDKSYDIINSYDIIIIKNSKTKENIDNNINIGNNFIINLFSNICTNIYWNRLIFYCFDQINLPHLCNKINNHFIWFISSTFNFNFSNIKKNIHHSFYNINTLNSFNIINYINSNQIKYINYIKSEFITIYKSLNLKSNLYDYKFNNILKYNSTNLTYYNKIQKDIVGKIKNNINGIDLINLFNINNIESFHYLFVELLPLDDIVSFYKYKIILKFINLHLDFDISNIDNIYDNKYIQQFIDLPTNVLNLKDFLLLTKFKYEDKIIHINNLLSRIDNYIIQDECPICYNNLTGNMYYIIFKCCKYMICNICYYNGFFANVRHLHTNCMFCQRKINKIDDIIIINNKTNIDTYKYISKLKDINIYKKYIETKSVISIINDIINNTNNLNLIRENLHHKYYKKNIININTIVFKNGITSLDILLNNSISNNTNTEINRKIIIISDDYMKLCNIYEKIKLKNKKLTTNIICKYNNSIKHFKNIINTFISNNDYKCIFLHNISNVINIILLNLIILYNKMEINTINIHLLNQC